MILKPLPFSNTTSPHPTLPSYQLRKHLSCLLSMKQHGARDVDKWNQECMALLLQVWRKDLELKLPKTITVSWTPKTPSKVNSSTKSTRHLVLKQIYGNYSSGHNRYPQNMLYQNLKWYLLLLGKPPFK